MTLTSFMPRTPLGWTLAAAVSAAGGFALAAHWNHALAFLPYLVILACPLMHLFMHGGHAGHGQHGADGKPHAHKPGGASCHAGADEKPQDSKTING